MKLRLAVLLVLVFTCIQAQQKGQEHWVATWTTAELLVRPPAPPPAGARGFHNQTVRMIARTSIGGHRLRVILSSRWRWARRISPFAPRIPKLSRAPTGRFLSTANRAVSSDPEW